jgi:hypothetical protein
MGDDSKRSFTRYANAASNGPPLALVCIPNKAFVAVAVKVEQTILSAQILKKWQTRLSALPFHSLRPLFTPVQSSRF